MGGGRVGTPDSSGSADDWDDWDDSDSEDSDEEQGSPAAALDEPAAPPAVHLEALAAPARALLTLLTSGQEEGIVSESELDALAALATLAQPRPGS